MPLLVAQRNTSHGVVSLDHSATSVGAGGVAIDQQPLDFTMSKYKTPTTARQQLMYRQFYGAEDSPPYDKHEEQGEKINFTII